MTVEATLGLGGNLGDPVAAFAGALARLRAHAAVELKAASSVWRTAPWGKLDQPEFCNMAVLIETSLSADDLLALCLDIERQSGRERRERTPAALVSGLPRDSRQHVSSLPLEAPPRDPFQRASQASPS